MKSAKTNKAVVTSWIITHLVLIETLAERPPMDELTMLSKGYTERFAIFPYDFSVKTLPANHHNLTKYVPNQSNVFSCPCSGARQCFGFCERQWSARLSAGTGWCEHASQAVIQP